MSVKVGQIARDRISGFKGVVVARTEWLHGCVRVGLASQKLDKDGKARDEQWFDEDRVEIVKATVDPKLNPIHPKAAPTTGGGREETRGHSKT